MPPYGAAPQPGAMPPYAGGYPPPGYPPAGYPPSPYAPRPYWAAAFAVNKHVGWFVVNWLFFWPLAIYSLVAHFLKIDQSLMMGDQVGAEAHAASVKKLGIIALIIGCVFFAIGIAFDAFVLSSVNN